MSKNDLFDVKGFVYNFGYYSVFFFNILKMPLIIQNKTIRHLRKICKGMGPLYRLGNLHGIAILYFFALMQKSNKKNQAAAADKIKELAGRVS